MSANVADVFVETLVRTGVKRVWGLSGDSLNAFTDAMRREGSLEWTPVRHEEVAAFAAAGEAAVTDELAVVAGSCGPGNLHLINGLFDAQRSRVPVLAIASHIPSEEIGTNYFQETKPQELFKDCSVYCELISDPRQIPWVLEIALRTAIEKRGVAVVVVPGDVFFADAPERRLTAPIKATAPRVLPSAEEIAEAATLLNEAKKVTILAGAGVAGSHDEVVALAERLQAPIVHAFRGKEHIEYDNPYDVGMTGLLGYASGYRAMEKCDALLMLGTDFPYRQFYPENAKIIQVDVRGEQLGRRVPLDLGIVSDAGEFATAVMPQLATDHDGAHLKDCQENYAKTRKELDELANDDGKTPIHPQYVARVINELADDDTVFTADVGTPVVWSARYFAMTEKRRMIGSFSHGSMANAMAQAIGAQAVDRDRQVIALCGDGGLSMLMGDLISIKQNQLPVKLVVLNNASLNFVELEMKAAGLINYGTELDNPNFADVANALGIHGERVVEGKDVRPAIERALVHDGPALVDIITARQELSIPPNITAAQAKGFSLWALRTVLSGRGSELVDLAQTNLWRRIRG